MFLAQANVIAKNIARLCQISDKTCRINVREERRSKTWFGREYWYVSAFCVFTHYAEQSSKYIPCYYRILSHLVFILYGCNNLIEAFPKFITHFNRI